jgi:hypothetical protein
MKKTALPALLCLVLLGTPLSHAMDHSPAEHNGFLSQDAQEQGGHGQEDEQYSDGSEGSDSGSDSELTDSGSDSNLEPEEESPLESYRKQLRNYQISGVDNPITSLHNIIMLSKPENPSTHEDAYKSLTYRIAKMLGTILFTGDDPNEINPNTGNTALADFFINHHADNSYLVAVVESMAAYGACLEKITRDQSDLRHLVQRALVNNTLTPEQYESLLESKTETIARHFKAERVRQESLRRIQARAKANGVRQEKLREKQDRAHERAVKRNLRRKPNLGTVLEETAHDLHSDATYELDPPKFLIPINIS